MEKSKLDLNKLSDDELDEIIAGLEEQDKKAAEDEIPMAEGMAREAFSQFVPGGQWLEAKGRSLVGPETMDEELAMVRGRQEQFREESPRASFLGGTAGALGQVGAATALLGPVGAAASLAGRFGLGATEQALQAGVGEGLSAEETAKRALIGGATEAVLPILPGSFQKGLAAGTLITGAVSPEDIGTGAAIGGLTGLGVQGLKPLAKRAIQRLVAKSAGVADDAKTVANWAASISMGGTLKNIGDMMGLKGENIDIRKMKREQQLLGSQALSEGLVSPKKTKLDVLEEIGGTFDSAYDMDMVGKGRIDGVDFPVAPYRSTSEKGPSGRIGTLVSKVDDMIDEFEGAFQKATGKKGKVDAVTFLQQIEDDINSKVSLGGLSQKDADGVIKLVRERLGAEPVKLDKGQTAFFNTGSDKVYREGDIIYIPKKRNYSLSEWNKEKRKLGKNLSTKSFMGHPDLADQKEAMVSVYQGMKKTLLDSIDHVQDKLELEVGPLGRDFRQDIEAANESSSNLINISKWLSVSEGKKETESALVKGAKFSIPFMSGAAGYALSGNPLVAIGAGIGAKQLERYSTNKLPQQVALALAGNKVPKTVKDIITYKDLIATKILLSGNMPLASQFLSAANNNNESDIEKMMPLISNEHPDIFPSTEYKSEYIDSQGQRKVTDSVDKEIIRNQIRSDEKMSNYEKAMKTQKLNRSGVIEGPKQAPNQLMLESMKYFKRPGGSEYLKMLQDKMKKPSDLNPTAKKQTSGVEDFMNRLQETHLEKLQRLAREKKGQ